MRQSLSHSSCTLRKSFVPEVVDIPVVAQMQIPYTDKVVDVSRVQPWRRQPSSHSCSLSYSCLDKVLHTPVVCNDICLVVQSAVNCDGCAVPVL